MSAPSTEPWSHNPNAPQIVYQWYRAEKVNFAGNLVGAMLYGIILLLFFQCVGALLNPVNRTKGDIKWGLVVHTTAMFLLVTIDVAMSLDLHSISYIEDREFPGIRGKIFPGPYGYQDLVHSKAINTVPSIMFQLNQWLADGLLLYRCYVIYATNYRVIAFPCLMYLACVAVGVADIYLYSQPGLLLNSNNTSSNFDTAYFSISLALNALLTLMIIVRLILHNKNIQNAMGAPAATSRLYKTVVTMLVESFTLYAVTLLLYIALDATNNPALLVFAPVVTGTQVIAPFLLILRVANRRALTSDDITSGGGSIGSIQFRTRSEGESTGGDETTSDENFPADSMNVNGEAPGGLGAGVENAIEELET